MKYEPRICLIDDDEDILDSLEALFRSRRLHVSAFNDPGRFLSIWQSSEIREVPSVFVIDIAMPGMSGVELFQRMCDYGIPSYNAVMFLTGDGDIAQAVEVMRRGAFDFVEKPFSDNSLVDRTLECCAKVIRAFEQQQTNRRIELELSPRERQVARLIAQGLTNKEIAVRLEVGVRTIETHRSHVFAKLGVQNAVSLALAIGYSSGDHPTCCPKA